MAHLYADENFSLEVVNGLRARGHDVLTTYDAGMANQGIPDEEVLSFATTLNRAVITSNRRHFMRLSMSQSDHAGIIVCTHDADVERLADRIDQLLSVTPILAGKLLRVVRPQR